MHSANTDFYKGWLFINPPKQSTQTAICGGCEPPNVLIKAFHAWTEDWEGTVWQWRYCYKNSQSNKETHFYVIFSSYVFSTSKGLDTDLW